MVIVTGTKGKPGSLRRTLSSIGQSIKQTFKKQEGAVVTTTPSGQPVIVSGTPSSVGTQTVTTRAPSFSGGGGGGISRPGVTQVTEPKPTPTQIREVGRVDTTKLTPQTQSQIRQIKLREDLQRRRSVEVFDPRTGTFERRVVDPRLAKGTREVISTRLPTEEEKLRIEKREKDILTIPISKLQKNVKEVKSLQSQLTKISEKNIVNNEWVGSESDLKKFNKLVDKFNKIDKTIKAGIGKGRFARQVDISQFDFEKKPISATSRVLEVTAGSVLGGVGETLGKVQEKVEKIPTVKIERTIQPFELKVSKPEIGRKVGEVIGETGVGLGKFAIPVAGGLFFGAEVGEFGVDVGKTIKSGEKLTREQKIEGAILGAVVLTGGAVKGARIIKRGNILRAEKELIELGKQPIRFLEVIEKPSGKVSLVGFQKLSKLERRIDVSGKLKKTEKGFEFLPEAKGTSITLGKVKGKIGEKRIIEISKFETGSRSISKQIEKSGELTLSKDISVSTFEPKISTFALFGKGKKGIRSAEKQLKENIIRGGDVIKDISGTLTLMKGRKVGLTLGKDSLGLTLLREIKPQKQFGIKIIGGKKTPLSKTFGEEVKLIEKPRIDIKRIKEGLEKPRLIIPKAEIGTIKKPKVFGDAEQIEKSKDISFIKLEPIGRDSIIQKSVIEQKPTTLQKIEESQLEIQKEKTKLSFSTGSILKEKQDTEQKQKPFLTGVQKPVIKEVVKEKTKQRLKETLQFKQLLKQKITQKQKSELKEKIKSIIPLIFPSGDVKTKKTVKLKREVFEAFGRRFGGDVSLGKFKTKEKAKRELKEFLFETLGASGFIEKEGVKLKAEETSLLKEKEFRKGLLSDFLIVEKKEKRLKKGTQEVPEIQFFKAKGKGSKKAPSIFGL